MFHSIISKTNPPNYLSSDNDPLFRFSRWLANLRILEIQEIKTVPYTPISHPLVERLIGTIRRELLDQTFFWNANDLQKKLIAFQTYYNEQRAHMGINEVTPRQMGGVNQNCVAKIDSYCWKSHCRGLFQLPMAA